MDRGGPSAKRASISISLPVSFPASLSMVTGTGYRALPGRLPTREPQDAWIIAGREQTLNSRPTRRVQRVTDERSWVYEADIFAETVAALRMRFNEEQGCGGSANPKRLAGGGCTRLHLAGREHRPGN
jgi:hypothetical protein